MGRAQLSISFTTTTAAGRAELAVGIVPSSLPPQLEVDFLAAGGVFAAELLQPSLQLQAAGDEIEPPRIYPGWLWDDADPAVPIVGPVEVASLLEAGAAEWSNTVAASTGSRRHGDFVKGAAGYELDYGGRPAPGPAKSIDLTVTLADRVGAGLSFTHTLLDGGHVSSSERTFTAAGHLLAMNGGGPEIEYREREIELEYAPDHGLTHGELAVAACEEAGVPAELILIDPTLGSERSNPVEVSGSLWEILRQILRPIGYQPIPQEGGIAAVSLRIEAAENAASELSAVDIDLETGISFSSDATVPQCVRVTGFASAERSGVPSTGTVTLSSETLIYEDPWSPQIAVASQSNLGTITPTGRVPPVLGQTLVRRILLEQTFTDGCLVEVKSTTWEYHNPVASRYLRPANPEGVPLGYQSTVYFFDTIPSVGDDQEAYQWPEFRFVVTSQTTLGVVRNGTGRRIRTTERQRAWYNPPAAVKQRTNAGDAWPDQNHIASAKIRGGGDGVLFDEERFFGGRDLPPDSSGGFPDASFPTTGHSSVFNLPNVVGRERRATVIEFDVDALDYEIGQTETLYDYGILVGGTYLYESGQESRFDNAVGHEARITDERRVSEGTDASHTRTTTVSPVEAPSETTIEVGVAGSVPAADICNAEQQARASNTPFEVLVCSVQDVDDVESDPTGIRIEELSSFVVETVDEARAWAELELEILTSPVITLPLAFPQPVLVAGSTIALTLPELGGDPAHLDFNPTALLIDESRITIEPGEGGLVLRHELICRCNVLEESS